MSMSMSMSIKAMPRDAYAPGIASQLLGIKLAQLQYHHISVASNAVPK